MPRWTDAPLRADDVGRTATTTDFGEHVRDLVEQVLFTRPGERVMRPTFGTGLAQLVFEPLSDELVATTRFLVQAGLQQWLSELVSVEGVDVEREDGLLRVTVKYTVLRTRERRTDTFERSGP